MYDCASTTTTAHPRPDSAAAASVPSLYLLGPAAFDSSDDDALSCPLLIDAAEGQHINLTLYDFGVTARRQHTGDDYSVAYQQVIHNARPERRN